ncbi:MAG: DUF2075 domain-containing protein [Candidatus Rokubacteria bacterium]|nr:DUF2075 domain-containing protein [Candidatus Rokubacteria bacterium]
MATYGWAGSTADLLSTTAASVVEQLRRAHTTHYGESPGLSQHSAWEHQVACLRTTFDTLSSAASGWGIVLEYELPFEGGRRADVVLLARDTVMPLEFKDAPSFSAAYIDQVEAYARDLSEYHTACRDKTVTPVLVFPTATAFQRPLTAGRAVSCDNLPATLDQLSGKGLQMPLSTWLEGEYAPLPTLVDAAKRIFRDEALPQIRRAESAGIPDALRYLRRVVEAAVSRKERHLVLVTGVPGSGKTLLGLQFVHELGAATEQAGVFLSGNDPLVEVLRDALNNKTFIGRMHDYILEYGVRQKALPPFHVIVFDEAQRAWDVERMREKKKHERSEPEILLDIASSLPDWGVVVGLVGSGQEIYLGEEGGLEQWRTAVDRTPTPIKLHVPPEIEPTFKGLDVQSEDCLSLTTSLRTHRASDFHDWVAAVMAGKVDRAGQIAPRLWDAPYELYFTTDLWRAKQYMYARYADEPGKRFGLLASSKSLNLPRIGIDSSFNATRFIKLGPWFNADPTDPRSCCQLSVPMTEFQCQGLELDMPLVCWGDDLGWEGEWVAYRATKTARDSRQLRINSYRVLLSRGRDGVIVFLPLNLRDGQRERLIEVLTGAGMTSLPRAE